MDATWQKKKKRMTDRRTRDNYIFLTTWEYEEEDGSRLKDKRVWIKRDEVIFLNLHKKNPLIITYLYFFIIYTYHSIKGIFFDDYLLVFFLKKNYFIP